MCLIIWKPKGVSIPKNILESAHKKNDDGWGLMRKGRKNIVIRKDVSDFNTFYGVYKKMYEPYECAVHFRMATCGVVCKDQAHPYKVSEDVYLMHNGMLDVGVWDDKKSDTWHLCQLLSEMAEGGWLRDQSFQEIVQMAVGGYNKLVILDKHGFLFFGKDSGVEYKKCWFSNTYAWDCPEALKPKPAKKSEEPGDKTTTSDNVEALALATCDPKIEEMREFWQSQLASQEVSWEELDNETKEFVLGNSDTPTTNLTHYDKSLIDKENQEAIGDSTFSIITPETLEEWGCLTLSELKLVIYDDPDAAAIAFHDLLQKEVIVCQN